jgi:modulator of FtsH protease
MATHKTLTTLNSAATPLPDANFGQATSPPLTDSAAREQGQKVLRDTYRLLSMTLVTSAITAFAAMAVNAPPLGLLLTLGGYFGLLFLTMKLRNSHWGLVSVFALTGFMGFTLGPILNSYLAMANGAAIVGTSMLATAAAFVGLSAYARSAKAVDMSKFGGFLVAGILVAFVLGLAAVFLEMPALSLAVSALFAALMCGLIMFETQNILRGGETNYILATVSLYVAIFNLFTSLLHLLGFANGEEGG